VELDPEFALAHAALAQCLAQRCLAWWRERSDLEQIELHARRALAMDPHLPEAHMALGMMYRVMENPAASLEEVKAAQMIDSNSPEIITWIGRSHMALGRPNEALRVLERGLKAHPRDWKMISAYTDCADCWAAKSRGGDAGAHPRGAGGARPSRRYTPAAFGDRAGSGDHTAGVAQAERAGG
jgi:tetratricopeptide (TPR) repeat protein